MGIAKWGWGALRYNSSDVVFVQTTEDVTLEMTLQAFRVFVAVQPDDSGEVAFCSCEPDPKSRLCLG